MRPNEAPNLNRQILAIISISIEKERIMILIDTLYKKIDNCINTMKQEVLNDQIDK